MSTAILGKRWKFMARSKNPMKKLDVRLIFDEPLSLLLLEDVEKEHRKIQEQIRYIVDQHYQQKGKQHG